MQKLLDDQHKDMKLQIQGRVPPGQQLYRNVLFDQLYASIPKDPQKSTSRVSIKPGQLQNRRRRHGDALARVSIMAVGGH
jgi:hypothetical protein